MYRFKTEKPKCFKYDKLTSVRSGSTSLRRLPTLLISPADIMTASSCLLENVKDNDISSGSAKLDSATKPSPSRPTLRMAYKRKQRLIRVNSHFRSLGKGSPILLISIEIPPNLTISSLLLRPKLVFPHWDLCPKCERNHCCLFNTLAYDKNTVGLF